MDGRPKEEMKERENEEKNFRRERVYGGRPNEGMGKEREINMFYPRKIKMGFIVG